MAEATETIISLNTLEGLDGKDLEGKAEKKAEYVVIRVLHIGAVQVIAALGLMGREHQDLPTLQPFIGKW